MNTHSKMQCPISEQDITIVSYQPAASAWSGNTSGYYEIVCPYRTDGVHSVCDKDSGKIWGGSSSHSGKNVCIMDK